VTTYRLTIVTGRGPLESPPLATRTFEAIDDLDASIKARRYTRDLVGNPEEEYGIVTDGKEWVADIYVSRDEEDAR
jgi:hypothetical protein